MTNTPVSVRLDAKILEFLDAEAARRKWSRNAVIQTCVEYALPELERESVGSPRKKIADVSVGAGAQDGFGVDPGLPREGKAQIEEIFQGVKVNIGLRAQGHFETVERMMGEGKTWDEIGNTIGWAGHAVQEWYEMDLAPDFSKEGGIGSEVDYYDQERYLYGRSGIAPDFNEVHIPKVRVGNDPAKFATLNKLRGMVSVIEKKHFEKLENRVTDAEPFEVDLCWREEYNPDTGQTGACGLAKGHKGKCGAWEVVG